MMSRYEVGLVDMGNGEKMPLLIDSTTGVGLYEPTAFSLALRSTGAKRNNLQLNLTHVKSTIRPVLPAGERSDQRGFTWHH